MQTWMQQQSRGTYDEKLDILPGLVDDPNVTLVSFPDPPRKAERGSGVLSDISCHMGRGRTS